MAEKQPNQIAVTTGLTIGEEAKGATVEWLAKILEATEVIRHGGGQAGHYIELDDGRGQAFSHFNCATFDGVPTHLHHMVLDPVILFDEAMSLESKGVADPLGMITIDQDCLGITPYHGALSRLKEIYRGKNKKGTIGLGVGDAVRDARESDEFALYARDFTLNPIELRQKIEKTRQRKMAQARELLALSPFYYYLEGAEKEVALFEDDSLFEVIVQSFQYLADLVKIVDEKYLAKLLNTEGTIVTEPSHGVLLHPFYGFAPHVTQVDTSSEDILDTLHRVKHDKEIIRLGVCRSFMTRHGAGPLVSFDAELSASRKETHNSANDWANEWLGSFRSGHFDVVALQYALAAAGSKYGFDGLVMNYMDALSHQETWSVVESYVYSGEPTEDLGNYFELSPDGQITAIKVRPNTKDEAQVAHQTRLTQLLNQCQPVVSTLTAEAGKDLETVFLDYVEQKLGVPVVAVSYGPKASDRQIRESGKKLFQLN